MALFILRSVDHLSRALTIPKGGPYSSGNHSFPKGDTYLQDHCLFKSVSATPKVLL